MVSRGSLLPLGVLHGILLLTNGSSSNQENKDSSFCPKISYILLSILFTCSYLSNIHVSTGRSEGDPFG